MGGGPTEGLRLSRPMPGGHAVAELSLPWTIGVGVPALVVQTITVAMARALRVYSRSRLEDVCAASGHPERADEIARLDERTERAAESRGDHERAGDRLARRGQRGAGRAAGVGRGGGRGRAGDRRCSTTWPPRRSAGSSPSGCSTGSGRSPRPSAPSAAPLTAVGQGGRVGRLEARRPARRAAPAGERRGRDPARRATTPRTRSPTSPSGSAACSSGSSSCSRMDVSEVMVPLSSMVTLPASTSAREAADGLPLDRPEPDPALRREPRRRRRHPLRQGPLPRPARRPTPPRSPRAVSPGRPYFVPETKAADELLEDLRTQRLQIAIVLDEYGGVAGLVTLEDLFEEIVGPIDDEHDRPTPDDPIRPLGESSYEVDGSLPLEDLNERLGLHLPTDGEVSTVGGYAFHALGRLPEPGATFRERRHRVHRARGRRPLDPQDAAGPGRRHRCDRGGGRPPTPSPWRAGSRPPRWTRGTSGRPEIASTHGSSPPPAGPRRH